MGSRALLRVAVVGAMVASAIVAPLSAPSPARGVGPLPDCRLDDILTEPRGYDDWEVTLVDWILTLGPSYRPPDLVSVRDGGVAGSGLIRAVVIDDLKAMAAAAEANGTPLVAWSPFRGYRQQRTLFDGYAGWNGTRYTNFDSAVTFSARPGHSEHQTGLTIDFVAVGDTGLTSNWEVTPTGGWMARNAWKYGWLMSYPKGKADVVCYRYEPWHYRYVGREMAEKIHESGLTIREYLWANHTQVDPACVALPPPELVTPGKPRSCAFPAPSPTAAPTATPTATATPVLTAGPASPGTPASPDPTPGSSAPPGEPTGFFGVGPAAAVGLLAITLAVAGFLAWRGMNRPGRSRGRG
jgi:zinc D-Ala-D-Ala carboxypeptidase